MVRVPKVLNEIAPHWANKIRKAKRLEDIFKQDFNKDVILDMNDNRFCLVGEARLFSDNYTQMGYGFCNTCYNFSNAFAYHASDKTKINYSISRNLKDLSYSQLIKQFYQHMKLKHKRDFRATKTQESQS